MFENITVNIYINKCYPYLKDIKKANDIEREELSDIKVNIKSLMLHRVGNYVLTATDNIVISKFIGIVMEYQLLLCYLYLTLLLNLFLEQSLYFLL